VSAAVLEVQTSRSRLKRIDREVEAALRQAGPPYRLVAVAAKCEGAAGVRVEVMALGVCLTRLEQAAKDEGDVEGRAWLRGCIASARKYYNRRVIPIWVTFAEGGAELWEMSPPGGTW